MTKTFSKELADQTGYGVATEISAMAADALADIELMKRMRKAEGRPSLDELEAADKAEFREMIADGYDLDPDVVAWALDD